MPQDALKQELLSKATRIQADPKATQIKEAIATWLPRIAGTTVGPKAVPLDDALGYFQKVIANTSNDVTGVLSRISKDPSAFAKMPTMSRDILAKTLDPALMQKGSQIMSSGPINQDRASKMIDLLAEMFLPNTIR